MSIRFTIHIVTVNYQYMSSLCYHKIHLLSFIWLYCTLVYNKYVILLGFICNHHQTLLISKKLNQFLCDIFEHSFSLQISTSTTSQKRWSTTHRKHWKKELYRGLFYCGEGDRDSDFNGLYCNQPVLAISLGLNVGYSVFLFLISFQEAPW